MPLCKRKKVIPMVALLLFSGILTPGISPFPEPSASDSPEPTARKSGPAHLTVLYDNYPFDPRLQTEWGFSCLIRGFGKTILFDTGGDGGVLLYNMRQLAVQPAEVEAVVLSHIHGDHTGGLGGFLKEQSRVLLHLPRSFPEGFKRAARSLGARVEEISEARRIFPGVYTTGELGDGLREQALVLKTEQGLVVMTGCAHPGVVGMVRKAREITGEDRVYLVIGGFHLAGEPSSRIESIAKEFRLLSVRKVAPSHCSGDGTRSVFRREFGPDYIESGVGKIILLPAIEPK